MTRYTIHVPTILNDGSPVAQGELALIESQILAVAGGYTVTRGFGAWQDNGITYRDPVKLYAVDSAEDIAPELIRIAERAAKRLAQEAVYMTAQDISVTLVTARQGAGA